MDLIFKFAHFLRECPNIQETILRSPALFWLIYLFPIPVGFAFVCSFVQLGTYGSMCRVFNHKTIIN